MRPTPTRTIGQLHFEDLDPRRFEDLVRQLAYNFRQWVTLEAIGRSGDDGGVDIRGIERRETAQPDVSDHQDSPSGTWLIQVKREKQLGPKRVAEVAMEARFDPEYPPEGFILAAPANFSRRSREAIRREMEVRGVRQVIVWGLGELEDMLFDPANDHLLFAYFGISLQVRRRNLTSQLRSRHARKRDVFAAIGGLNHRGYKAVLLRDPECDEYPFSDAVEGFESNPAWMWTSFRRHSNPGTVALVFRRHHAWISAGRDEYDLIETCSHVTNDHAHRRDPRAADPDLCERLWTYFHSTIPRAEQAWVLHVGIIDLDDILLVDDLGDALNPPPHLLVLRNQPLGFFRREKAFIEYDTSHAGTAPDDEFRPLDELQRVDLFPSDIPRVERDGRW